MRDKLFKTLFQFKPKMQRKNKTTNTEDKTTCGLESCNQTDVDLIKCNICSTWVCEGCNDVPVAELKAISNKC
jgi:hypothetical protein